MSHEWAKALVATGILTVLVASVLAVPEWRAGAVPVEDMTQLASALFNRYVFPFEVLSVLLLGALIGALHMGMKERRDEGARK